MSKCPWKYVLNKKYIVQYKLNLVEVYEAISKDKKDLIWKFKTKEFISNVEINPFVENIILISFFNGSCKIYNILNKSENGDIEFESIKDDEYIELSIFNKCDPNIIATLNTTNDIFIWDIRNPFLLSKIMNYYEVIRLKWNHYRSEYIEIQIEKKDEKNIISHKLLLFNYFTRTFEAEIDFR